MKEVNSESIKRPQSIKIKIGNLLFQYFLNHLMYRGVCKKGWMLSM